MNNIVKSIVLLSFATLTACSNAPQDASVKNDSNKKENIEQAGGSKIAQKDSNVKVLYKGTLEDGTVFDESKDDKLLEFILGSGQLIKGFDSAVEGMKVGEEKKINIPSKDAYGQRNEQLIKEFPSTLFPPEFTPTKGAFVTLQDQTGRPVPGQIVEIAAEKVKIDLNHPLAGKDLTFEIKVISIE